MGGKRNPHRDRESRKRPSDDDRLALEYNSRGMVIAPDPYMNPAKFRRLMDEFVRERDFINLKHMRIGTWLETKKMIERDWRTFPETIKYPQTRLLPSEIEFPFKYGGHIADRFQRSSKHQEHPSSTKLTPSPGSPKDSVTQEAHLEGTQTHQGTYHQGTNLGIEKPPGGGAECLPTLKHVSCADPFKACKELVAWWIKKLNWRSKSSSSSSRDAPTVVAQPVPSSSFAGPNRSCTECTDESCMSCTQLLGEGDDWFHTISRESTQAQEENRVIVVDGDTLEVAYNEYLKLQDGGPTNPRIGVLNMACYNSLGGGYKSGAGAQEENLCRRTNLVKHLGLLEYPLDIGTCSFSENVVYLRGSESEGYPRLDVDQRCTFAVLSSAAYRMPPLTPQGHLTAAHAAGTYLTISAILRTAKEFNLDTVVLSAFGCGAYGNPPADVARLFKFAIKNESFRGTIVFAILGGYRAGDTSNIDAFLQEFPN